MYTCMYTCIKICNLCACVALTSEKNKRGGGRGGGTAFVAILKAYIMSFYAKRCKGVKNKSKSCASLVYLFLADKRNINKEFTHKENIK